MFRRQVFLPLDRGIIGDLLGVLINIKLKKGGF